MAPGDRRVIVRDGVVCLISVGAHGVARAKQPNAAALCAAA